MIYNRYSLFHNWLWDYCEKNDFEERFGILETLFLVSELCDALEKTEKIFEKYLPPNRNTFFPYTYFCYKYVETRKKDNPFPTPSRFKAKGNDKIWEKICSELNWEFIPTIDTTLDYL